MKRWKTLLTALFTATALVAQGEAAAGQRVITQLYCEPVNSVSINPDAPVISLSGLSKGYLAPGWRTGWLVVGGGDRLNDPLLQGRSEIGMHRQAQHALRERLADGARPRRHVRRVRGLVVQRLVLGAE